MLLLAYFAHLSEDLFPAFLNIQLIQLIPDIIRLPNVHLDAAIIVVYYCILYHGCFLRRQFTSVSDNAKTMSKLYHQCLDAASAWESQATGTTTDFIAAFFMVVFSFSWLALLLIQVRQVRVAAERFDIELSWNMFKLGCQYAEKIELHRLDNDPNSNSTNLDNSSLEDYKARPDLDLVSTTEALCRDIETLYEQWEIDAWVRKMIESDGQLWTIAGVALEGYTCIIFMLRRAISVRSGIPENQELDPEVTNHP
ncbi:hypothetical protein CDV36_016004, partial [Fusarium kuroshium]